MASTAVTATRLAAGFPAKGSAQGKKATPRLVRPRRTDSYGKRATVRGTLRA